MCTWERDNYQVDAKFDIELLLKKNTDVWHIGLYPHLFYNIYVGCNGKFLVKELSPKVEGATKANSSIIVFILPLLWLYNTFIIYITWSLQYTFLFSYLLLYLPVYFIYIYICVCVCVCYINVNKLILYKCIWTVSLY